MKDFCRQRQKSFIYEDYMNIARPVYLQQLIDRDDNLLKQRSAFGTITRIADHMLYFDCGDGEDVSIPFDPEHIERSDPALIYNLHNPQTTITGVDFTSEWTIYHSPED